MTLTKSKKRTPQTSAKNKCDELFSKLIRSKGYCERCLKEPPWVQLQTSHWLSRRFSNTRTDPDNAFCLCAACHRWWHSDPTAATDWAIAIRGRETYDRLREAANEPSKIWWPDEVERLKILLEGREG